MKKIIEFHNLEPELPDAQIVACASLFNRNTSIIFVSNDLSCLNIARNIFHLRTNTVEIPKDDYSGYKDITLSDEEMSYFYTHMNENIYDCLVNEYLIIRKSDGEVVDTLRWDGEEFKKVCNKTIKSLIFGDKIKPKDIYQACAIDSIYNNTMTTLSGKAGSGKSLLSLVAIMNLI